MKRGRLCGKCGRRFDHYKEDRFCPHSLKYKNRNTRLEDAIEIHRDGAERALMRLVYNEQITGGRVDTLFLAGSRFGSVYNFVGTPRYGLRSRRSYVGGSTIDAMIASGWIRLRQGGMKASLTMEGREVARVVMRGITEKLEKHDRKT